MLVSQIFKKKVPNELLFNLLEVICVKDDKTFTLNYESFKKGMYNGSIDEFILSCKEYYHTSKQKYLIKPLKYPNFITIIRQICNLNKIVYNYKIKYDKSNYTIVYYIGFNNSES